MYILTTQYLRCLLRSVRFLSLSSLIVNAITAGGAVDDTDTLVDRLDTF